MRKTRGMLQQDPGGRRRCRGVLAGADGETGDEDRFVVIHYHCWSVRAAILPYSKVPYPYPALRGRW
jgi:hypothetical protein